MADYQVTVELDTPEGGQTTQMVVATIDAPDQQTANAWRRELDDFIGKLTGGLREVTGTHASLVTAARSVS
jgi:hypothetical protein